MAGLIAKSRGGDMPTADSRPEITGDLKSDTSRAWSTPPPAASMLPVATPPIAEGRRECSHGGGPLLPTDRLTPDRIPQLWEQLKEIVLFYHGTSQAFLASIKQHGLSGAIKPLKQADLDLFYDVYKRVHGEAHPLQSNNHHSNPVVFVSGKKADASFYASKPSEVCGILSDRIPELLEKGRELISPAEHAGLLEMLKTSQKLLEGHSPVVLEIKGGVLEELAASQGTSVLEYLRRQLANLSGDVSVGDFLDAVFRMENEFELPPVPQGRIKNLG